MNTCFKDYRTTSGTSRCSTGETVLEKYLRVAKTDREALPEIGPLPLARPTISFGIGADDYLLLLDVLDKLFLLESAARYADRKASDIARRRLYQALSRQTRVRPQDIEKLFIRLDRFSLDVLRRVAGAIIEGYEPPRPPLNVVESGHSVVLEFTRK